MAPAPFKAVLVLKTASGKGYTQRCDVSDVVGEFYIFQDGSSDLTVGNEPTFLVDVQLTAAGTDTTTSTVFANQRQTGEEIQNGLNLASNLSRQYLQTPVGFKAGARIKFRQNA